MKYRLALPGERYAFKRVKSDAAAARRVFAIPFDLFAAMCHEPCHYCGRIDINKISVKSRSAIGGYVVKDFRYNGIDRLDNSIGYVPENCVPCCVVCNRGKNSMGLDAWIEYLDTLIEFRTRSERDDDISHLRVSVERRNRASGKGSAIYIIPQRRFHSDGTSGWEFPDGGTNEGRGEEVLSVITKERGKKEESKEA